MDRMKEINRNRNRVSYFWKSWTEYDRETENNDVGMALDEPGKVVLGQIVNKDPELGKRLKYVKEALVGTYRATLLRSSAINIRIIDISPTESKFWMPSIFPTGAYHLVVLTGYFNKQSLSLLLCLMFSYLPHSISVMGLKYTVLEKKDSE